MKFLPKNTLAYFDSAPQFKAISLGHIPVSVLGASTKLYRSTAGLVSPDTEAIEFYAANHCASEISKLFTKNEILPAWAQGVMDTYLHAVVSQGQRLLHYILCVATREARHTKAPNADWWAKLAKHSGAGFEEFAKKITQMPSENEAIEHFMNNPPACTARQYANGLVYLFQHGKFGSSFGGTPWAMIAKCAADFLSGHTSMLVLVDTAYTLAHNNGPMFNKGMLYEHYTGNFITILDIQHSGQIPALVLDKTDWQIKIPAEVKTMVATVAANLPEASAFATHVDWHKVAAKNGGDTYHQHKVKQAKLHPVVLAPTVLVINGAPVKIKLTGTFEIFPEHHIPTFERLAS
jgi:hypothetical protein